MKDVIKAKLNNANYRELIPKIFERPDLPALLAARKKIIIKPNLVPARRPPCTTDVRLVDAVVGFCREVGKAEIIVAEGSGGEDTRRCFQYLGYEIFQKRPGVRLIDLDRTPPVKLANPCAYVYKEVYLPEVIMEGFFISVPALKDHSITKVTLSLKNLIGILSSEYYGGYWSYKKSEVHRVDVEKAVVDLCGYRRIDLSVIDGSIGQRNCHLSGPPCHPPKNLIIAGRDPVAVDVVGAEILGKNPLEIPHIVYAEKTGLGSLNSRMIEIS